MLFNPWISDYIYIPILLALIGAGYSLYTDMKDGLIKNYVTFPLFFVGLAWSLIFGGPKMLVINFALSVGIGIVSCFAGKLGAGDIKLNMAIAACLQPILNILFLLFFFIVLLCGALLKRFSIHQYKLIPAFKAMKDEIFFEIGGMKNAGDISHGHSVRHLGAPIILVALIATVIMALYTGGLSL